LDETEGAEEALLTEPLQVIPINMIPSGVSRDFDEVVVVCELFFPPFYLLS